MTQDKVFIIDEYTQNAIKKDPEYADLKKELQKQDFRLVCFDNKQDIQLFSSDNATPIEDYQGMVIKSDLYIIDKSFYPLFDYTGSYFVELNMLMKRLASFMGAYKWEFSYVEENFESLMQNEGFEVGGEVGVKSYTEGRGKDKVTHGVDFGVGFGYARSNASQNSNEAQFAYQHSEEFVDRKKSPKELERYIKEQNINLNAFDPSFKEQINDYINGLKIGTTKQIVDKSRRIIEYNKSIVKINASINALKIFEAKFKFGSQKEFKTENKQKVKLLYQMSFK